MPAQHTSQSASNQLPEGPREGIAILLSHQANGHSFGAMLIGHPTPLASSHTPAWTLLDRPDPAHQQSENESGGVQHDDNRQRFVVACRQEMQGSSQSQSRREHVRAPQEASRELGIDCCVLNCSQLRLRALCSVSTFERCQMQDIHWTERGSSRERRRIDGAALVQAAGAQRRAHRELGRMPAPAACQPRASSSEVA